MSIDCNKIRPGDQFTLGPPQVKGGTVLGLGLDQNSNKGFIILRVERTVRKG